MKIIELGERDMLLCELGACGRRAEYAVTFPGLSPRENLNLCGECLRELERATRFTRKRAVQPPKAAPAQPTPAAPAQPTPAAPAQPTQDMPTQPAQDMPTPDAPAAQPTPEPTPAPLISPEEDDHAGA